MLTSVLPLWRIRIYKRPSTTIWKQNYVKIAKTDARLIFQIIVCYFPYNSLQTSSYEQVQEYLACLRSAQQKPKQSYEFWWTKSASFATYAKNSFTETHAQAVTNTDADTKI